MGLSLEFIVFAALSYLIGAIPFGLIVTKLAGLGDIRAIGSGNIGATNVLRTGNKPLAALTLFLDAFKGAIPIIIFLQFFPPHFTYMLLYGLCAVIGHCFPIWLKFKGGKGVATSLGVLIAAVPFTGLLACLVWIMSALAARISSLAAISAMIFAPALTFAIYGQDAALVNAAISAIVIYRHKDNIKRLRSGTEPKIGQKKDGTENGAEDSAQ
ncbi:MAG: glycerol-3-phosphate 1-O-acyltransferase PlsY [Alphaproteobacteria bacterium]